MAKLWYCFSPGFVWCGAPTPAPVNQPQTARITKEAHSATGAPLWRAILKLTCLLFVGSEVKLLTLPSIPPSRSPHRGQAVLWVLYLHGLESFHAEEKSWFTVKARGAVHAARVATLFTGRQWPYCSYVEKEGAGGKRNPPFAMAKSYTCATERGGPSPIRFFKQSKQSLPTVNKMKMSKAFRQGGEMGFRG